MAKGINRRHVSALALLADGERRHRGAFYEVGGKTFKDLLDNAWATEERPNGPLTITALGMDVYQKAIADGIEPIPTPDDHCWFESEDGVFRVFTMNGRQVREFKNPTEAWDYKHAADATRMES